MLGHSWAEDEHSNAAIGSGLIISSNYVGMSLVQKRANSKEREGLQFSSWIEKMKTVGYVLLSQQSFSVRAQYSSMQTASPKSAVRLCWASGETVMI